MTRRRWPERLLALLLLASAGGALAQQRCSVAATELSLPTQRFVDNGDGTVTDRRSLLTWMRCAFGQRWAAGRCEGEALLLDWTAAQAAALATNSSGALFFNDWRVPRLPELAQIGERHCENPRTNLALFPGTPAAGFWSATPRAGDGPAQRRFVLSFGAEGVFLGGHDERFHLRLVRTGP